MPYYIKDPKTGHNFDNHPFVVPEVEGLGLSTQPSSSTHQAQIPRSQKPDIRNPCVSPYKDLVEYRGFSNYLYYFEGGPYYENPILTIKAPLLNPRAPFKKETTLPEDRGQGSLVEHRPEADTGLTSEDQRHLWAGGEKIRAPSQGLGYLSIRAAVTLRVQRTQ